MSRQADPDRDADAGLLAAVDLANAFVVDRAVTLDADPVATLARILAVDPSSVAQLTRRRVEPFTQLARRMHAILAALAAGDIDGAAHATNAVLGEHLAHPHLAREDGRWRLHHHPADMPLLPMWHAICAEAIARLIGSGRTDRIGVCAATGCEHLFVDRTKNSSRRFCSLACQNRTKAAAFRRRGAAG